jgi:hypothetical protein
MHCLLWAGFLSLWVEIEKTSGLSVLTDGKSSAAFERGRERDGRKAKHCSKRKQILVGKRSGRLAIILCPQMSKRRQNREWLLCPSWAGLIPPGWLEEMSGRRASRDPGVRENKEMISSQRVKPGVSGRGENGWVGYQRRRRRDDPGV